jgi:hypothetical protein
MVEMLPREAERAELRGRFATDALAAQEKVLAGGKTISLARSFDYLLNRCVSVHLARAQVAIQ